jgi:polygalacturonase
VEPERLAGGAAVEGRALRFAADGPGPRVVWMRVGGRPLPPLFVIVEPPEASPPKPGDPGVLSVADYGAAPSGDEAQTAKLQKALDDCAARPAGGVVYVPPGLYRTGTLRVGSRTTLYLAGGAVLQAVGDPAAFPVDGGRKEEHGDGRTHSNSRLLFFENAEGAALAGRGTLDALGHVLRNKHDRRVQVIDATNCRNLVLEGVVLRDSASWTLHILHCDNVRVSDLKILGDHAVGNTDGIDPDASRNVLIERLFSWSGDDAIAVKTTGNSGLLRDACNITVRDSVVLTRKTALKVGTETRAAIRNVLFENIDVLGSSRGCAIWARDGGAIENVVFRDIRMSLREIGGEGMSGQPFYFSVQKRGGVSRLRGVTVQDVTCRAPWFARIEGIPESPVEGLTFENVSWTVLPRSIKKEAKPLFDFAGAGPVAVRGLTVDWTAALDGQWSGLWSGGAPVSAEGVVERGTRP